jgi:methylglyoxal synthase
MGAVNMDVTQTMAPVTPSIATSLMSQSPLMPDEPPRKRIALIAHDHRKADLLEWARYNVSSLKAHELLGTGTTGKLVSDELGVEVTRVESGPLGGDLQIGAMIADGTIDMLVFFWDPLEPQPHDPDVKALLRVAVVWNIPIACNRATADFLISSPLMTQPYERATHHYGRAMTPQSRAAAEQGAAEAISAEEVPASRK